MESLYTILIFVVLLTVIAVPYWRRTFSQNAKAAEKFRKSQASGLRAPVTLHPHFELSLCIGCASCVKACPEHVLGLVAGRPVIISGVKCIGHGTCAEVCPVGAITLGFGTPTQGMEIPYYDLHYETNLRGVYIIGELGGIGLIRNAVKQGTAAVQHIADARRTSHHDKLDLVIVGAGPAGLSAALAAQASGLRYVVLEQDEVGGALLHYPRQKLVLTNPVELPLYGKLKVSEISKEELLDIWLKIVSSFKLSVLTSQSVQGIRKDGSDYVVSTATAEFKAAHVLLALGRRGSPRKLGVPGENLTKVMYRLIEAESYKHKHLLVVGGGDSAVEAALGLAAQPGNTVTMSYRRNDFIRLKEKNEQNIRHALEVGRLKVLFNSEVVQIDPQSVLVREDEKIVHTLPNEFVFVFAGGELPTALLKNAGITMRSAEMEAQSAA